LFEVANTNNTTDAVDIGYYGRYYDAVQERIEFTGLFRDASDAGKFKIFSGLVDEPTNVVNTTGTGYTVATLVANVDGNLAGTANAANILSTARTIAASGDATWSVSFNGSANVTSALTLANTGVTATTYGTSTSVPTIAVDGKGRITSASNTNITFPVTTVNGQAGTVVLTTADVAEGGANQYFTTGRAQSAISLTTSGTSGAATYSGGVFNIPTYIGGSGSINEIAFFSTTGVISSLTTATYPSLTELSYVKGVTSAIQTQLNNKLNLSGGTLTGPLSGTSATFSGLLTANAGLLFNTTQAISTQGSIGFNSAQGVFVYAKTGSSYDFKLYNGGGATVLQVPTGTQNVEFLGDLSSAKLLATSSSNAAIITSTGTTGYALVATGSAGGARDIFLAGQSGFSNGFTVQFTGTEMKYIFSSGNIGVGVNVPNEKLSVAGNITTSSGIAAKIGFNTNDAFSAYGTSVAQYGISYGASTQPLALSGYYGIGLFTVGEQRLIVRQDGNVGIGIVGANDVRLFIKSAGSGAGSYNLYTRNSSNTDLLVVRDDGYINMGLAASSPYNYIASGRAAILDSIGSLGYLVSTRESKANIESIKNIDFIKKLNPVQFNYRKKDNKTNLFIDEVESNLTYGFIADEVEIVNKELVFYNNLEDGSKKLAGVEYNSMIAILTKAVQEQQAQIEELKALIAAK